MNDKVTEISFGKNTLAFCVEPDGSSPSYSDVLDSWNNGNFCFIEERSNKKGLRSPQIGGTHAVLGHLKSDDDSAATIVMPTGTGKTETILSIVLAGKFKRTLVLVPSDALREQTAQKFLRLGLLRELGLIDSIFLNPRVKWSSEKRHQIKTLLPFPYQPSQTRSGSNSSGRNEAGDCCKTSRCSQ